MAGAAHCPLHCGPHAVTTQQPWPSPELRVIFILTERGNFLNATDLEAFDSQDPLVSSEQAMALDKQTSKHQQKLHTKRASGQKYLGFLLSGALMKHQQDIKEAENIIAQQTKRSLSHNCHQAV